MSTIYLQLIKLANLCAVLSGSNWGFAMMVPLCSLFSGFGITFLFLFLGLFCGLAGSLIGLFPLIFSLLLFFGLPIFMIFFFSLLIFFSFFRAFSSSSSFSSFWIPLSLSTLSSSSSSMMSSSILKITHFSQVHKLNLCCEQRNGALNIVNGFPFIFCYVCLQSWHFQFWSESNKRNN